jgi:hypothetical protein
MSEPTIGFNYDALDAPKPLSVDEQFFKAEAEIFSDMLGWVVEPTTLGDVGARCCLLTLALKRRDLIRQTVLKELEQMPDAATLAVELRRSLIQIEEKFGLRPST